jgi:hypothetical protein
MAFAPVESRSVVADFDGGAITSDAGALLLGAADRAVRLVERFAGCFTDGRDPERVVHDVATLVGQRVFAIALGPRLADPASGAAGRTWSITTSCASIPCSTSCSNGSTPGTAAARPWPARAR